MHVDYSCTPKGIWSGGDQNKLTAIDMSPEQTPTYLLTYVPSPSPEGTCHQIVIKVDHKHATIYAPHQYCNTKDPLSDPLKGTDLDVSLLNNAKSLQPGVLPLAVQTSTFAGPSGAFSRINVSAQIPSNFLKRTWDGAYLQTSIAILGLVYDKNGLLVQRFSDIACVSNLLEGYNGPLPPSESNVPPPIAEARKSLERMTIPTSYQTQLEVIPGDYRLELMLTDGEKFGRATASVTVDDPSKGNLAINGVAICKRYHIPSADEKGPTRAPQYYR